MPRKRRQRPLSHSLLHQYREADVPRSARIAAVQIEDPYGVPADENAKLLIGKHTDKPSEVVRNWQAPPQPKITVIQSLRNDTLAHMFARRQIDQASYKAGRAYQALREVASISPMQSKEIGMPFTPGSRDFADEHSRKARAMRMVTRLEIGLARVHGGEGVRLIRAVLIDAMSIEQAAGVFAPVKSSRWMRFYGQKFRLCLDELAKLCGYVRSAPHKQA
jgi:hypothetical protein